MSGPREHRRALARVPHIRICLNSACGFACSYCKPGGETTHISREKLGIPQVAALSAGVVNRFGLEKAVLTGGDPLLRRDLGAVIEEMRAQGVPRIEMNTKGLQLRRAVGNGSLCGLDQTIVNIDSLQRERYWRIAGRDRLDKVLDGLEALAEAGLPFRINFVVMRENFEEIPAMLDLATRLGVDLKLHELLGFRVPDDNHFSREYIDVFEALAEVGLGDLGEKSIVWTNGGLGVPMHAYSVTENTKLLVFHSRSGAHFGDRCRGCPLFPCQEGLYGIKITHDGWAKFCWARDDIKVDLREQLEAEDVEGLADALEPLFSQYSQSEFREDDLAPPIARNLIPARA
jgi:cyclic pyranopterin phosphate synthase